MPHSRNDLIRRNLRAALKAANVTPSELSKRLGLGKDYIGDFLGNDKTAPKKSSLRAGVMEDAEQALQLAPGALLQGSITDQSAARGASPLEGAKNGIPVFGRTVVHGDDDWRGWIEIGPLAVEFSYALAHFEHVPGAYAVYYGGQSMEPRFTAGDLLLIHPTKPIRQGCYALLMKLGRGEGTMRAIVRRVRRITATSFVVQRYNPFDKGPLEYEIPRSEIVQAHRIVGSIES